MSRLLAAVLVLGATVSTVHAEAPAPEVAPVCRPAPASAKLVVPMSAERSLHELSTWVASFTCKNVIFGVDVASHAAKLTVIAPGPLTSKQALSLFVDAAEAIGLTVVQKRDSILIKLGKGLKAGCSAVATGGDSLSEWTDDIRPSGDPILDAGLRRIDATHLEVTRAAFDHVMGDPDALLKGARIVPTMQDSEMIGVKLYAIRPRSVLARLGFTNGDTVLAINAHPLTSADAMLGVPTLLAKAHRIEVALVRRGKPSTLVITIK